MSTNDPNVEFDWLENFITEERIKCYEYSDFKNVQKIGKGTFGYVVRVNWKTADCFFALKSFNDNEITLKEVVNEVQCSIYKNSKRFKNYSIFKTKITFYYYQS